MFNQRGLGPVVATALLVLITIAAAVIILRFAVPFVKNTLNDGSECFNYRDYFVFEENYGLNCYIITNSPYEADFYINIGAKTTNPKIESKVAGFKLLLKAGDNLQPVEVLDGAQAANNEGAIRMYDASETVISIPKGGESRSYIYNGPAINYIYKNVEIYPILKSGKLCEISDSARMDVPCGNLN